MIKEIKTNISNFELLWETDLGSYVALKQRGGKIWTLYEEVYICADSHGYIGGGLNKQGEGRIIAFRSDSADKWIGVLQSEGNFGWVKPARVMKLQERRTFLK